MEYNSKPKQLYMINNNISSMIEKKANTIMKPKETLEGLSIA